MPYRFLTICDLLVVTQLAEAGGGRHGPPTFDDTRRRILAEKFPDAASEFAIAMAEKRAEYMALQAEDGRGTERKLEKMDEEIAAMQAAYKEEVAKETADLTEDAEKLAERQDRLFARFEKAEGEAMEKIDKELKEVKLELDFITLKKTLIGAYGGYGTATPAGLPESMIGTQAHDFRLTKPESDPRSMETVSRAPIRIFVFMSTANGTSAAYAAGLHRSYQSERDVDVIAIAVGDTDESWAKARLSGFNRMTVLLDPDGKTSMKYKVGFVPQTVVVDPDRQIRQVTVGDASAGRSAISKAVRDVLKERE